jgi:hypothetical protein
MSSKKKINTLKQHAIQIKVQCHLSFMMKVTEVIWETKSFAEDDVNGG